MVKYVHGHWQEIENCHNPQHARDAHNRVARNPKVIDRIELHDHEGSIETIWSRSWI
jgi:hypothetical protein